jgi:GTP-binding protein EngB required for normal cell division
VVKVGSRSRGTKPVLVVNLVKVLLRVLNLVDLPGYGCTSTTAVVEVPLGTRVYTWLRPQELLDCHGVPIDVLKKTIKKKKYFFSQLVLITISRSGPTA